MQEWAPQDVAAIEQHYTGMPTFDVGMVPELPPAAPENWAKPFVQAIVDTTQRIAKAVVVAQTEAIPPPSYTDIPAPSYEELPDGSVERTFEIAKRQWGIPETAKLIIEDDVPEGVVPMRGLASLDGDIYLFRKPIALTADYYGISFDEQAKYTLLHEVAHLVQEKRFPDFVEPEPEGRVFIDSNTPTGGPYGGTHGSYWERTAQKTGGLRPFLNHVISSRNNSFITPERVDRMVDLFRSDPIYGELWDRMSGEWLTENEKMRRLAGANRSG